MQKPIVTLLLFFILSFGNVSLAAYSKKLPKEFDPILETTKEISRSNFSDFLKLLSLESEISKDIIADMIMKKTFTAQDIVLATGLAKVLGSRANILLRHYRSHRSVGWMLMAHMKKVKKGSPKYKRWLSELSTLEAKMKKLTEKSTATKGKVNKKVKSVTKTNEKATNEKETKTPIEEKKR